MQGPLTSELTGPDETTNRGGSDPDDFRSRERERLYEFLREHPLAEISQDEVDAHFQSMPPQYWERVTKAELLWGLETAHTFLRKVANGSFAAAPVLADWRHYPERGVTKVMICAWDRRGLLTKIAAAFSALRVNILRADVFTRADNLALDVFEVTDSEHRHIADAARFQHLVFLLEGALSDPPRFASVWAGQFHKTLDWPKETRFRVDFDNDSSDQYTVLRVEASDRLGLLHDVLRALTASGLNIAQALVETQDDLAHDQLYVTDFEGSKILDVSRLESIRNALHRSLSAQGARCASHL
jgi:[protein-PII] uridylyltransferase